MKLSKGWKLIILGFLMVVIDQIIKVLVMTNMNLGESIAVIGDWCKLNFVLNDGMAFGMAFGGVWGKLLLSMFRILLSGGLIWWISKLVKTPGTPIGVLVGLTLITAGAIGNIIDSFFYGIIWPGPIEHVVAGASEYMTVDGAPFSFMFGKVVDMFYFPLFDYDFWGFKGTFFGAVFNFADACVTCGAIYLLLFQYKFFSKEEKKQ